MRICPNCYKVLKPVRCSFGTIYLCVTCEGHQVSIGFAKQTLSKDAVVGFFKNNFALVTKPIGKLCPGCRTSMHAVNTGQGHVIDLCQMCLAVWFDEGESDLPSKALPEASPADLKKIEPILDLEEKTKEALTGFVNINNHDVHGFNRFLSLVGLPIEHDVKNPANPIMTLALILVCFLIHLMVPVDVRVQLYGFDPTRPWELMRWFTSFFMHADWLHLLGNMYFLWLFGDNVEEELGPVRLFILAMFSHFLGCIGQMVFSGSDHFLVGASGGIFGIVIFYCLQFPQHRIVLNPLGPLLGLIGLRLAIPAWLTMILFSAKEFLGLFIQIQGITNVSHLGHVFGGIMGLAYWMAIGPKR